MPYTVGVRALCEFTAKQGDLDIRFTPSPTALEGMEGHAAVAARRGAGYQTEVALEGEFEAASDVLRVRGRADGFDPARQRLEEIKTHRGPLTRQPDNHRQLHWAQARIYGHLMCCRRGLAQIELALVYLDVDSQRETVVTESRSAADLQSHFEARCGAFLAWAAQELAHRAARDAALRALAFPHPAWRRGQRELAQAVYRAAGAGRCLAAQAPTGIGKTVGTVFPLLKAMPVQQLDKLYFLTAKTSGRALALDALARLRHGAPALPLRTLELVARDKACEHPDRACHGSSCPLALGFYDRLPAARVAALALPVWDRPAVRALAQAHAVCPYYLGQELARWSDVVVGDYNHYFDGHAMLHALAVAQGWRVGVLVDEAHNLVERARAMHSAELEQQALARCCKAGPAPVRRAGGRVQRCWNALRREPPPGADSAEPAYRVLPGLPAALVAALQGLASAIGAYFSEHPEAVEPALQGCWLELLQCLRLVESFDGHSMVDLRRGAGKASVLCLRNVVPAPFLQPRFRAAHTATLFSATLRPQRFYADLLGLPADTAWVDIATPFDAAQLAVRVAGGISTRYAQRQASLAPIAGCIAGQYRQRPGLYLAFFSSFEYLAQAAEWLEARHPDVPLWRQERGMSEAAQAQFLARFQPGACGVGFAVLGGAFAEGIDLPGERLIGAFIATLGLPQVNAVNEQMRERMQAVCGSGYDYTYLFPGLRKVVQAAGRVIRTPSDRGVLHLMDERFLEPRVRRLLPAWWAVQRAPPVPSR